MRRKYQSLLTSTATTTPSLFQFRHGFEIFCVNPGHRQRPLSNFIRRELGGFQFHEG